MVAVPFPDMAAAAFSTRQTEPMLVAMRSPATDRCAVQWAARRAVTLNVPLTLFHAVPDPSLLLPGTSYSDVVIAGHSLVSHEIARIVDEFPGLRVGSYLYCGDVLEVLLGLAAVAPMIVVGSDRKNSLTGEFQGSVAMQVALASSAPVVVVPRDHVSPPLQGPGEGGVVVGIDGSEISFAALDRAVEEAHLIGTHLTVVTVLPVPSTRPAVNAPAILLDARKRHPQTPMDCVVDDTHAPVEALVRYGAGADLLVIGRHGQGAPKGMSVGSVTRTLLLEPPCPTLVVTHPALAVIDDHGPEKRG